MTKFAKNNPQGTANIDDDRVLGTVIKIKKGKINFNSRKFKKGLERIRKESEKIDNFSKIDPIRMLDRFDI